MLYIIFANFGRLCVGGRAATVDVIIRKPHWVFPRSWFASKALTRLFWRLCSGEGISRRLTQLCKVAVALHYIRSGIRHLIPRIPMTDPKTAISDEFFACAKLNNVHYWHGDVQGVEDAAVRVRESELVRSLSCDMIVLACGFERPAYQFLRGSEALELYLGSWAISDPQLCFLGVGLGEGVFPNPHTMRPQVDVLLNHLLLKSGSRSAEEMQNWLRNSQAQEGEVRGSAASASEHLAELVHQRRSQRATPTSSLRHYKSTPSKYGLFRCLQVLYLLIFSVVPSAKSCSLPPKKQACILACDTCMSLW